MVSWKAFETKVKSISNFIWNCDAVSETISGVKCDCVLKYRSDYWIIVEITENNTLEKVRTDIAKIGVIKPYLFSKNTYCETYLVMSEEPTDTMKISGEGVNVNVISYDSFSKKFLDYNSYVHGRLQKSFGSSVNPFSGAPDTTDYTPVLYENIRTKKQIELKDIIKLLTDGKRIILLGNYGTGKSRCIREIFYALYKKEFSTILYPIAINLKENWGITRHEELLRRHFGNLGVSHLADSAIKIINTESFIFLLDGFDEIGAQLWSDDSSKLQQIRSTSLSGVKDLIRNTKSPLIISGREHYFNSEDEMFSALGLSKTETVLLRSKDEFSETEMENYLKSISSVVELPLWLPRRPLICQIINSLEKNKLEEILFDTYSAVEFWDTLINNVCIREARISPLLDSDKIFRILKLIARFTRSKSFNVGPLTMTEINKAFEFVIGTQPVDESAVMLQRLPALGRVSSESLDRQFIDFYILDGLRAEDLVDIVYNNKTEILNEVWINPLKRTGIEIIAKRISCDKSANIFIEFLKSTTSINNKIIAGDIIACLVFYSTKHTLDMGSFVIHNVTISSLDFSSSLIENFIIQDSHIEEVDVSNCSFSRISFRDCIVTKVYGVSNETELPSCLNSSIIEFYEKNSINTNNKFFGLKPSQMILISLLKKTFFYAGHGRLESELLKSFGNTKDKNIANQVLKYLVAEKILSKNANNGDTIYIPKGFHRQRISLILKELNFSTDPIWIFANGINNSC
jgi:hypothetical protein